ncbi:Mbov_0396 family ICE element transmembrane protein [Mycoplasmopsis gallinarum]|uniref:Mbov_0396 family ICE element transmembrane protein n=1 Tax=Mycoplasmopsis gallinarum TaxID=29557 RepID=UPI00048006D2|nr:hypothetical protein [Mycoplasmopsis gallinarum]
MFGWVIKAIVNPIINGFGLLLGGAIWTVCAWIAAILFLLMVLFINIIKLLVIDLPVLALFGIKSGTSDIFNSFITIRPYMQFLIVSIVIWVLCFFTLIIKTSLESDSGKVNVMVREAAKASGKSVLLLLVFQLLILFFNVILSQLLNAFLKNSDGTMLGWDFVANFAESTFPLNWQGKLDPDPNSASFWLGGGFTGNFVKNGSFFNDNAFGIGLTSGLLLLAGSILLFIPLVKIFYLVLEKMFIVYILFIIFPFMPAFSLIDGGKRVQIWKEKFFNNLIVGPIILLAFIFVGIFVSLVTNNLFTPFMQNARSNVPPLTYTILSIFEGLINAILLILVWVGVLKSLDKLPELFASFVGVEVNWGNNSVGNVYRKGKEGVQKGREMTQNSIDKNQHKTKKADDVFDKAMEKGDTKTAQKMLDNVGRYDKRIGRAQKVAKFLGVRK